MELANRLRDTAAKLPEKSPWLVEGRVVRINGILIEATAQQGTLGDICEICLEPGRVVQAEIVGFNRHHVQMMALGSTLGISPGNRVRPGTRMLELSAGPHLLGRVLDGLGKPIDRLGPLPNGEMISVYNNPPESLQRQRIAKPLETGIRAIDGLLTLAEGQRVGIFAGSGVGKSVLLGMLARHTVADINVIALIGERGREVREFLERDLGPEALKRSVVVVATSDQSATVRIKAALLATRIAEYFRDRAGNVLLMMDSLTRVAMAQREIGLATGEPPASRGYTPSVFTLLPALLERAGNNDVGSITGIYTVLVEGDDMDEPISDAARSILDGHLVLKRELAVQGHFPAIEVLESISRVKSDVISAEHNNLAMRLLAMQALYKQSQDLIQIGAYTAGSNKELDLAISKREAILAFLRQQRDEKSSSAATLQQLQHIMQGDAL